jgi:hypothetical protein
VSQNELATTEERKEGRIVVDLSREDARAIVCEDILKKKKQERRKEPKFEFKVNMKR